MDDLDPQAEKRAKISEIDKELVWRLGCMMCTFGEIADVLGITEHQVKKKFGDLIDKARSQGKKALRRAQFEKAVQDKDPRMLIFLGKQYLSQKDNPEDKEGNAPLPWNE
jgi:DNA-binding CsgD family transcriptional regulator